MRHLRLRVIMRRHQILDNLDSHVIIQWSRIIFPVLIWIQPLPQPLPIPCLWRHYTLRGAFLCPLWAMSRSNFRTLQTIQYGNGNPLLFCKGGCPLIPWFWPRRWSFSKIVWRSTNHALFNWGHWVFYISKVQASQTLHSHLYSFIIYD